MVEIGYALSSEEHPPEMLVRNGRRAEEAGFTFALISDHFHPWIERQGHSPFVWSVLGGIACTTKRLRIGTGVTCPIMRMHPAIVAQAAATAAAMLPDRFFLGVGSGENLNEHVVGRRWPPADVRLDMLEEAITVIRLLWEGGEQSHCGRYFRVQDARLYTLPDEPPPIVVAAGGREAIDLAARAGDGIIGLEPDREFIEAYDAAGGHWKPRYAQATVCWAEDAAEARRTAYEWWPIAAIPGGLKWELPRPVHFEEATALVTEQAVAGQIPCGPDPELHLAKIRSYIEAGYDHVYIHQIGPDQEGFFRFYQREVLPRLSRAMTRV